MVALQVLTLLAAAAPLASAHFGLVQPSWRADTLSEKAPERYSQWTYPCAGVLSNDTGVNVTDWPLDGGSVVLDLHHAWTYLFINIGLQPAPGVSVTTFNYSLTGPTFWNVTGNGTLFIEKIKLPVGLNPVDGQRASLQVITPTTSGAALYNCADIRFRANATALSSSRYKTSDGITLYQVQSGPANGTSGSGSGSGSPSGTASTTPKPGAAASVGVNGAVLSSVVGLAAVLAYGMIW